VPIPTPMQQPTEEELVETALLRWAQEKATKWGAARFAAEFERREREERWLQAARSNTFRAPGSLDVDDVPGDAIPDRHELDLNRPTHSRHASVPRPPAPIPEEDGRRSRRRRRARRSTNRDWVISSAEAARMSPAGRRLYGLEDPPDRSRP
jgi:hypothetical protein